MRKYVQDAVLTYVNIEIQQAGKLHTNYSCLLFAFAQLFQFLIVAQNLVQLLLQLLSLLHHLHSLCLLC